MTRPAIVVVGGGIAGVAAAAALAPRADVTLVEMEATLAYHTTGRSAALYVDNYGHRATRQLAKASRAFLEDPPEALADGPLLTPRGALTVGRSDQLDRLRDLLAEGEASGATIAWLETGDVVARCPVILRDHAAGGLWEPEAADIDVAALHQAFVRDLRRHDGAIVRSAELIEATRGPAGGWRVTAGDADLRADVIVDAAGAWGDVVARRCGVEPLGLEPRRRTAFMVPGDEAWGSWPMVIDADHDFYFKPDGAQLLCSPADETVAAPHDATPEEIDVAIAIDRINAATTLGIRSVRSAWAGLRTFAPGGGMVVDFDDSVPGFFWLVGQGGTGIQTAAGAGRLTAALVLDGAPSPDLVEAGVDQEGLGIAGVRLTTP